jgi:hypothetical protein
MEFILILRLNWIHIELNWIELSLIRNGIQIGAKGIEN